MESPTYSVTTALVVNCTAVSPTCDMRTFTANLCVMVEENTTTGGRLDEELERALGECANFRGELRDVRDALVLNNNHGSNGVGNANNDNSPNHTTSNHAAINSGTSNNLTAPTDQESFEESYEQNAQDDTFKRLNVASSPIERRSSASDKSISPIDNVHSPIGKKERNSPIDRTRISASVEKRNGSPSQSPNDKSRHPWTLTTEKSRIGGSGGSIDSRSGSTSPDRGSRASSFFQRNGSERLRTTTNRDSIRSSKESNEFQKNSKDDIDGDVRLDEENEPPAPAPGSRPTSPSNPHGLVNNSVVVSRHSGLHLVAPVEVASARRLRLENERLVAEVARLRRLLLSGAARGEVGGEDAAIEEEARFVALEMELQHSREVIQALKTDRKRLKAEKFDLLNQMKALYSTLEDKERELRDFIRNYEQVRHCTILMKKQNM
ncbi:hypothetical protein PV325_004758 [Microctonus aethiopoides]|nr:hypothetical protein PV325_004758 [Microctonus aethiopoides]